MKDGIKFLAKALTLKFPLMHLLLINCAIDDDGIATLVDALKHNSTLTRLSLRLNQITDIGAQLLFNYISTTSTLTHAGLEGNRIGKDSKPAICHALRTNRSLIQLWMDGNALTRSSDGPELMAAWKQHPSLISATFFPSREQIPLEEQSEKAQIILRNRHNISKRNLTLFAALYKMLGLV